MRVLVERACRELRRTRALLPVPEFDGAATNPGWIAANVVCTGTLLYVLLFLPDAAIFLQKDAQRRLRVLLNCVKHMRRCFLLLALGQAYTVYRVLGTASHIAATLKSQVKWLHQEQARLRAAGLDQDEWRLNAADLDTMRWGVKLLGYNVDREFWSDFKLNGGLLLLALISVFVVIWGYIQDERERQSKPRRTVFEKMAGSERKAVERAQVSAATVGLGSVTVAANSLTVDRCCEQAAEQREEQLEQELERSRSERDDLLLRTRSDIAGIISTTIPLDT